MTLTKEQLQEFLKAFEHAETKPKMYITQQQADHYGITETDDSFVILKEVQMNLKVSAHVRYWEDGYISKDGINFYEDKNGEMPCRNGDVWEPIIDVRTGQILNWEIGVQARLHYKVCDEGIYTFGEKVWDGYVPDFMCPEGGGFGDYIIMNIDENGFIKKWGFE